MKQIALIAIFVLILAAVGFIAFKVYAANAEATIAYELNEVNSELLDDEGAVSTPWDKSAALRNAAKWAENNQGRGLYSDYEVEEDAVYFHVSYFGTLAYAPDLKGDW